MQRYNENKNSFVAGFKDGITMASNDKEKDNKNTLEELKIEIITNIKNTIISAGEKLIEMKEEEQQAKLKEINSREKSTLSPVFYKDFVNAQIIFMISLEEALHSIKVNQEKETKTWKEKHSKDYEYWTKVFIGDKYDLTTIPKEINDENRELCVNEIEGSDLFCAAEFEELIHSSERIGKYLGKNKEDLINILVVASQLIEILKEQRERHKTELDLTQANKDLGILQRTIKS